MLCCRVAFALLATLCAGASGCQRPPIRHTRSDPVMAIPQTVAGTTTELHGRTARTFTIVFTTFIPRNFVLGPLVHPQSYRGIAPPLRLAFAGDDRAFDVDATSYRSRQEVTIIPEGADDGDGLLEGSKRNLGGVSKSFIAFQALANGRIDERDRGGAQGDFASECREASVDARGMIIDDPVRLGPHAVFVRLRTSVLGGPRNRLIRGSPSIDWDIGITIDTSGPEPIYEVVGTWDGYPAAELYINRQPVFTFTPGAGSGSPVELLKLLPGYADFRFKRTGRLSE
jgi:hypothetical protein